MPVSDSSPPLWTLVLAAALAVACPADPDAVSPGTTGAETDATTSDDGLTTSDDTADGSSGDDTNAVALRGAVQKGPFILGSTVSIAAIDAAGNPTGEAFSTQTTNDRGEFAVDFDIAGSVALEGNGFYYNEATGTLSTAPLTLRAVYVIEEPGEQSATINLFTHLAFNRIEQLLADGASYADAVSQAEHELVVAIDVGYAGFEPMLGGVDLDLAGGDTDENAYLLAVSAVLSAAALEAAGGMVGQIDARLQELINAISLDLADDGAIDPALTDELRAARHGLDTDAIEAALAERFVEIDEVAAVPDMDRVLDQDDDGAHNDVDNCRRDANTTQADGDTDGIGDVCDPCPVDADNVGGLGCPCAAGSPTCAAGLSCPEAACVPTSIVSLSVGQSNSCVLLDTGAVRCWGYSSWGSLGYPGISSTTSPAPYGDIDFGGAAYELHLGSIHGCVRTDLGTQCWGSAVDGVLGYGNLEDIGDDEPPSAAGAVNLGPGWDAGMVAAGTYITCVTRAGASQVLKCWGAGLGDNEEPVSYQSHVLDTEIASLDLGNQHGCVRLVGGAVRCWGGGFDGQLGYGNTASIPFHDGPIEAGNVSLGGAAIQVSADYEHSCAVLQGGAVRCWGWNLFGQLGLGHTANIGDNELPTSVSPIDLGGPAVQVVAGMMHTCALLEGGDVRCWGSGEFGQLGQGNTENIGDDELPSSVPPIDLGEPAVQIGVGQNHSCALLASGAVRCWGEAILNGTDETIGDDEPVSMGDVVEVI